MATKVLYGYGVRGPLGTLGSKKLYKCSVNTKLGQKNRRCGKLCVMASKVGQKNPRCKFMMMMIFMEVKGHQRSNAVNYALWSKESLMQAYDGDDLHEGQNSSEVKCGKLYTMVPKHGQKNFGCKFKMMIIFMDVKGQMGSNKINYVP